MDIFAPYEQAQARSNTAQQRAGEAQAHLHAVINGLMAQKQGRFFLRWLMHNCQCFSAQNLATQDGTQTSAHDTARLCFAEGRRYVGMTLLRLVQCADPQNLPQLFQIREDEDAF
ncbi:Bbp19 family protein [Desulfovibrio falkowii]|uniref:Bbp19-like phage domain-containing protein n=1 Tax=Desulfovibrio falkowii TaxID=3136602 RepID=A0ABQ0E9T8_9BACT